MHATPLRLLLLATLLAGCSAIRPADIARLDLGSAPPAWQSGAVPLAAVSVVAPAALTGSAIHYRLLYADDQRIHAYAESRWAAAPGELIERALNRQSLAAGAHCRLRIDLDRLVQVFDTPRASRTLLEVRASLIAPASDVVLARRAIAIERPAASSDARGGVAAAAAAVHALGGELTAWLDSLHRAAPTTLPAACGAHS